MDNQEQVKELLAIRSVFKSEVWNVVAPQSRNEALILGRHEWCTGREDNNAYENMYSQAYGKLYVFFRNTKKRPQYQAFFSEFGTEFRNGGNVHVDIPLFLNEKPENSELAPFFAQVGYRRLPSLAPRFTEPEQLGLMDLSRYAPYALPSSDFSDSTAANMELRAVVSMLESLLHGIIIPANPLHLAQRVTDVILRSCYHVHDLTELPIAANTHTPFYVRMEQQLLIHTRYYGYLTLVIEQDASLSLIQRSRLLINLKLR